MKAREAMIDEQIVLPRLVALRGGLGNVPGVRLAGVHAGIKKRSQMRGLVCNSGCANACTGSKGERDARATARQAAALLGIPKQSVVVSSTGVIGIPLPIDRISKSLERAVADLEAGGEAAYDAAEAIMTTDRVPKLSAYAFYDGEKRYVVGGIAKGSGMISPNMATIATDAPMSQEELQAQVARCADGSFNMISVDGDMSTNDAVYAFAPASDAKAPEHFGAALRKVCEELAQAMVADGEGATKTLSVHVTAAESEDQARAIARAVINSNLVKTALFGEDPNWGRIVSAAGSARAGMDPEKWSLYVNDLLWVDVGAVEVLSEAEAHRELEHTKVHVRLDLGIGRASATGWGCDLSRDYVRINANYRT